MPANEVSTGWVKGPRKATVGDMIEGGGTNLMERGLMEAKGVRVCVCACEFLQAHLKLLFSKPQNLRCTPSPGEQIAFSKIPWGGKNCSAFLFFSCSLLFDLSPSKHFVFLWYPIDTSLFFARQVWIEINFSLCLCCCCGHKPFLSRAVSAVIETYYLCFLPCTHRKCWIFKAGNE